MTTKLLPYQSSVFQNPLKSIVSSLGESSPCGGFPFISQQPKQFCRVIGNDKAYSVAKDIQPRKLNLSQLLLLPAVGILSLLFSLCFCIYFQDFIERGHQFKSSIQLINEGKTLLGALTLFSENVINSFVVGLESADLI